MTTVGSIKVDLIADIARFSSGLAGATAGLRAFKLSTATTLAEVKGNFLLGMGGIATGIKGIFSRIVPIVTIAGIAMAAALGLMVKAGADFEDSMNRAAAIVSGVGASFTKDFQDMSKEALLLGKKTLFSANDVAKGMQVLARAGFSKNQIIKAMPGITNLAIVADEKLAVSTSNAIGMMYEFGLKSKDMNSISDMTTKATNMANMSVKDLSAALQYAAPVAAGLGMKFSTVAAMVGVLKNRLKRGSMAGRSLSRAFVNLLKPSAVAKLAKYGVALKNSTGHYRNMIDVLSDLRKKHLGIAGLIDIFGTVGIKAAIPLLSTSTAAFKKFTKAIEDSGGLAEKTANKYRDTLIGRLRDLKASLINLSIYFKQDFGGAIKDSVYAIRNWVNSLTAALQKGNKLRKILDALMKAFSPITSLLKNQRKAFLQWIKDLDPKKIQKKLEAFTKSAIKNFKSLKTALSNSGKAIVIAFKDILKVVALLSKIFLKIPSWAQTLIILIGVLNLLGGGAIIGGVLSLGKAMWGVTGAVLALKNTGILIFLTRLSAVLLPIAVAFTGLQFGTKKLNAGVNVLKSTGNVKKAVKTMGVAGWLAGGSSFQNAMISLAKSQKLQAAATKKLKDNTDKYVPILENTMSQATSNISHNASKILQVANKLKSLQTRLDRVTASQQANTIQNTE